MSGEVTVMVGSVEYLYADVTADVVLDSQPVRLGVGTVVADATWLDAEWLSEPGKARSARILLDGTLAVGRYYVWVKITDTPEVPIFQAGTLRISGR